MVIHDEQDFGNVNAIGHLFSWKEFLTHILMSTPKTHCFTQLNFNSHSSLLSLVPYLGWTDVCSCLPRKRNTAGKEKNFRKQVKVGDSVLVHIMMIFMNFFFLLLMSWELMNVRILSSVYPVSSLLIRPKTSVFCFWFLSLGNTCLGSYKLWSSFRSVYLFLSRSFHPYLPLIVSLWEQMVWNTKMSLKIWRNTLTRSMSS